MKITDSEFGFNRLGLTGKYLNLRSKYFVFKRIATICNNTYTFIILNCYTVFQEHLKIHASLSYAFQSPDKNPLPHMGLSRKSEGTSYSQL